MKNVFVSLLFLFALVFTSGCGKDDVTPDRCNATLFNEDINPKLASWQDAASAYANDQSVANCNNYKSTGDAFLESIRSYQNCGTLYTQTWQDAVTDAQAELAALPCN